MRHWLWRGALAAALAAAAAADEHAAIPPIPAARGQVAAAAAMDISEMQRSVTLLAEGRSLFQRGEYPQAADALHELLADAELPAAAAAEARLHLGRIAEMEGDWAAARAWLAAVAESPETPPIYRAEAQFHVGRLYMLEGDALAAPALVKALEMPDATPEYLGKALHCLGRMALEEEDEADAEQYLHGALAIWGLKPEDGAATRLLLGGLAQRQQRWAAARDFYSLVLNINLNHPESTAAAHAAALLGRAAAWQADGRMREAEGDWRDLAEMSAAPMHLRLAAQRRLDAAAGIARPARGNEGLACDFSVWAEAYAGQTDRMRVAECGAFALFADRTEAGPGERWLDFFLDLRPAGQPSGNLTVEAWLYDAHSGRRQSEVAVGADSVWGWLRVDMRRHGLAQARLRVELRAGRRLLGAVETTAAASAPPPLSGRIPVILDAPPGMAAMRNWPVAFGVPFAPGALWDLHALRLVNDTGIELPCQKEITGRWAEDGAIQWVRFDALAAPAEGCRVEFLPSRAAPDMPVRLVEKKGTVTVDTGMARYVLGPGKSPVQEVLLANGGRLAFCGPQSRGLYVLTQDGRLGQAARDNAMQIESRGPVSACVRFEGYYRDEANGGAPLARHVTRLEFFAGQAAARMTHTLVLSADTRICWFKEIGWEMDGSIAGSAGGAAAPRASFGVERANPERIVVLPLASPGAAAYMLQAGHYRFHGGSNHCLVMHEGADAPAAAVYAGAEMGDWAMLDGAAGGLMLACRESARQHPKEFEIRPDRVVLRLFSNRAGEALDFRADTLIRKWNLEAWYPPDRRAHYRKLYERDPLEAIAAMESQAAGWAKTHEILIAPLAPAQLPEALPAAAARLAHLLAFPVYAQADPEWVYRSRAMGAVYSRRPGKYAAAEDMLESLWRSRLPGSHPDGGWYGFADYGQGPEDHAASAPGLDYPLRRDLWLACARAWDRDLREFVEGATRVYLDNYLCHWPAPRKTVGLYNAGHAAPSDAVVAGLPFYWGDRTACIAGGATDLLQFQWLYQIGGYRRAADAWRAFGEGLKTCWSRAAFTGELVNDRRQVPGGRVLMALRVLAQAYACDWDPELRFLLHDVGRLVHDPAADIGITKRRPRPEFSGSYHMVHGDAGALLDAWEITGAPRYRNMARRLGDYVWNTGLGVLPNNSLPAPLGRWGVFFYDETGRSDIAAALDFQIRRACAHAAAAAGAGRPAAAFPAVADMPMMMDVLERHAAAEAPVPAWIAFDACDQPCRIALRKPHGRPLEVGIQSGTNGATVGGRLTVWPLADARPGCDQVTVSQPQRGMARVHFPLEVPGVDYVIASAAPGLHLVLADQPLPLVIYAPQDWRLPDLRPALPVYFRLLPESDPARRPRLLVEGGARFYEPNGAHWRGGAMLSGWVDLPGDRPGLWRFEPEHNRCVRAVNLPPFFALGRPELYFEPDLPWDYQPLPDAARNDADSNSHGAQTIEPISKLTF